jgi:ABC-type branched-subunit amino acid transport system substrate-binding protein
MSTPRAGLGRPGKLVYYDDRSNSATVPALYQKLLDVDKVDIVIGGYGTNLLAPAMPVVIQKTVRNGPVQLSESPEFNTKSKSAFRYLPSLLGLRASCGLCPAHGSPGLWGSSLK